jgi:phage antirepressor YoqD-like protein
VTREEIGIIEAEDLNMKENDMEPVGFRFGKPPGTDEAESVGKTMTTKEVADSLGCAVKTVFENAKICLPDKRVENGKTTLWTENEVTILLEYLKQEKASGRHSNLYIQSKGVETAKSLELEAALAAQKAIELQQMVIAKLKAENEAKRKRLEVAEPKAETLDKMTATASDISVRELAAILAVPHLGQNNLFQKLRDDGYIDGLNRPYWQYIEGGLMYEKEYYVPQLDATKRRLRITQKGVAHFVRKYAPRTA